MSQVYERQRLAVAPAIPKAIEEGIDSYLSRVQVLRSVPLPAAAAAAAAAPAAPVAVATEGEADRAAGQLSQSLRWASSGIARSSRDLRREGPGACARGWQVQPVLAAQPAQQ